MASRKIIFFDGVCSLCNNFVDYLIDKPSLQDYKFSSIQGETAKELLEKSEIESLDTVIVYIDGQKLVRSTAALHLLSQINSFWKIFWIIPTPIRDFFYKLISKYRYKVFGKRETCRLPTPEEKNRFLD